MHLTSKWPCSRAWTAKRATARLHQQDPRVMSPCMQLLGPHSSSTQWQWCAHHNSRRSRPSWLMHTSSNGGNRGCGQQQPYLSAGPPMAGLAGSAVSQMLAASEQLDDPTEVDIIEEMEKAATDVASELGLAPEAVQQAAATLQLLLPDMAPTFVAFKTSTQRWQGVADALAGVTLRSVAAAEMDVMARVMRAVRAAPRDSEDAQEHSALTRQVCDYFASVRVYSSVEAGGARSTLQRALAACIARQQAKLLAQLTGLVRTAVLTPQLAERLIALRTTLPRCNASRMIVGHPGLLRWSGAELAAAVERVTQLLGPLVASASSPEDGASEVARLLESAPYMLEPDLLEAALQELASTFPEQRPAYMLSQHVKLGASAMLLPFQQAAAQRGVAKGGASSDTGSSSTTTRDRPHSSSSLA